MPLFSATHVTPHFSRGEMGYDTAPAVMRPNIERVAQLLEEIRAAVGVPLRVTSVYRTPERNAQLPGASMSSQHLTGSAADFKPVGISVAEFLRRLIAAGYELGRSQLILYPVGSDHVHIGLPNPERPLNRVMVSGDDKGFTQTTLSDSLRVYALWRERRGAARVSVLLVLALVVGALLWFRR